MEITTTTMDSAFVGETEQRPWWLTLIAVLGMWWLVQGIFDIIAIIVDHSMWGWKLFVGVISFLAGSYILMYPIASAVALPKIFVLMMGMSGVMYGVILLIIAFKGGGWSAGILGGLGIIFGVVLTANYMVPGVRLICFGPRARLPSPAASQ